MNNEVIVSVCMITYNHASFIEKSIIGVLAQKTKFKIELIISNDCSSDSTHDVISKVLKNNHTNIKVKYFNLTKNIGMVKNFHKVLTSGNSKYLAICEGDDYWQDDTKLQKQIEALEKNKDSIIAFHKVKIQDENNSIINKDDFNIQFKDISSDSLVKAKTYIPTNTLVFRNIINNYPIEFFEVLNTDTFLLSMLGAYGNAIFIDNIRPSVYSVHSNGVWSKKDALYKAINHKNTYKRLKKYYKNVNKEASMYFDFKVKNKSNPTIFYHAVLNKNFKMALPYFVLTSIVLIKKLEIKKAYLNLKALLKLFF